jgi:hypothetical protein
LIALVRGARSVDVLAGIAVLFSFALGGYPGKPCVSDYRLKAGRFRGRLKVA